MCYVALLLACPSLGRTFWLDLMTPKHGFLFDSYDFQAVLFLDPYELCGVEWLTSSVGMDFPKRNFSGVESINVAADVVEDNRPNVLDEFVAD